MEIKVTKENLSNFDCGGGYRENDLSIFVDETLPPHRQRQVVIFETLSALLDPLEMRAGEIEAITDKIVDALSQLE